MDEQESAKTYTISQAQLDKIHMYDFIYHAVVHASVQEIFHDTTSLDSVYDFLRERDYESPLYSSTLLGGQTQQALVKNLVDDLRSQKYDLPAERKKEISEMLEKVQDFETTHPNPWHGFGTEGQMTKLIEEAVAELQK